MFKRPFSRVPILFEKAFLKETYKGNVKALFKVSYPFLKGLSGGLAGYLLLRRLARPCLINLGGEGTLPIPRPMLCG